MDRYVWDIDFTDKKRLMKLSELHYNSAKDLASNLSISYQTYRNQKSSEETNLSLETSGRLLNIVNRSSFRFKNCEVEEIMEEEITYAGEKKVRLNPKLQQSLLSPFSEKEINERLEGSKSKAKKIKRSKIKSMPYPLFHDVIKRNEEIIESRFKPEGDIIPHGYNTNLEGTALPNASFEEVFHFRRALNTLSKYQRKDGPHSIRIYRGALEETEPIIQVLEAYEKDLGIDTDEFSRETVSGLKEIGVIERWGGKASSYYTIEENEPFIRGLLSEARRNDIERVER